MPTKKRRVGFIPRGDVLDLINKLSYESNLSYSKVINILVEEALFKRGLFNLQKDKTFSNENNLFNVKKNLEKKEIINQISSNNLNNEFLEFRNLEFNEVKEEPFDNEMYAKFLLFLQFQERMKKRNK